MIREPQSVAPLYLVLDTSGSTVRGRWIDDLNQMVPQIVEVMEASIGDWLPGEAFLSIISFGTSVDIQLPLTRLSDIQVLPALVAQGFTSLAGAFDLLTAVVDADMAQILSDAMTCSVVTAILVLGGLPTDAPTRLLHSRRALTTACPELRLGAVLPEGTDPLPVHGLSVDSMAFSEGGKDLAPQVIATLRTLTELALEPTGPSPR